MRPRWSSAPRTASEWFARLRRSPLTAADATDFRRWVGRAPQHRLALEEYEQLWAVTGELHGDRDIAAELRELDEAAAARSATRWPTPARLAMLAAGVFAMTLAGFLFLNGRTLEYRTAVGEQREIVLPDRSRLLLNTASHVQVRYGSGRRTIELHAGEAIFTVSPDPARPFEVRTGDGIASAVGTQFAVWRRSSDVLVAVLEGHVRVSALPTGGALASPPEPKTLQAGQQVTYAYGAISEVQLADLTRIHAWENGRIEFQGETLAAVVDEFNRYSRTRIELGDPSLAALRISGAFRIGAADALARALERALGLRTVRSPDRILVLPPVPPIEPTSVPDSPMRAGRPELARSRESVPASP